MNNIKNADDVREWARMIVDAKGEKYTPLSKTDLYQIALCIMETGENAACGGDADTTQPPPAETVAPPTTSVEDNGKMPEPAKEQQKDDGIDTAALRSNLLQPVRTAAMTRGYAYHRANFGVQEVYDKFLEWAKEHPKEGKVMDFSNGVQSANAAFAYWLAEVVEVELPPTVRGV